MRFKWPKSQFPKLTVFLGQKTIFRHDYIQNVKDGIQIQVNKINKDSATNCSLFISVKVEKILRISHPQFWGKAKKIEAQEK